MTIAKPALGYPSRTAAAVAMRADGQDLRQIANALGVTTSTASALLASSDRKPPSKRTPRGGAGAVAHAVASEAAASGDRRRLARSTSTVARGSRLPAPSPAERIATALAEEPADVIAAMKRRWPETWARVLVSARAADVLPFGHLIEALELGLDAIATKRRG